MKKTLIALAVLAASGASFAQVSITGNLTAGYQSYTVGGTATVPSTDSAGFLTETATLAFNVKEDLGGGYVLAAKLGLNNGATNASSNAAATVNGVQNANYGGATAEDTTLTLVSPMGLVILGTTKGTEYLGGGLAGVGAYYAGWDGKVMTARTVRDSATYALPLGAFTLAIVASEAANTTGAGGTTGADAAAGTGSGTANTALSVSYASGKLAANGTYIAYKNSAQVGNNKDTTRLSGNYDFGMLKLGAGVVLSTIAGGANPNTKVTDLLVGVKMPVGASSFGLSWASRQWSDAASIARLDGSGTGIALEYGYAMSKRTSLIANYARWTQVAGGLTAGQDSSNMYQLLLSHAF